MIPQARGALRPLLLALALLATGAASALADTLTVSPSGAFTATTSRLTVTLGGLPATCSATLQGTLSSPVLFNRATAAGTVTAVRVTGCNPGYTIVATGPPWRIIFSDVLLDGSGDVTGFQFTVPNTQFTATFGFSCRFAGSLTYLEPVNLRGLSNTIALQPSTLTLQSGIGCPSTAVVSGSFARSPTATLLLAPPPALNQAVFDFSAAPAVAQVATLVNSSTVVPVTVTAVDITGPDAGQFADDYVGIPAGPGRCEPPRQVAAPGSCRIRLRFVGAGAPPLTASIDVTDKNGRVISGTLRR